MIWTQFKTVFPVFAIYFACTLALSYGLWYLYRKTSGKNWLAPYTPAVASLAITLLYMVHTVLGFAQGQRLYALQESMNQTASNKSGPQTREEAMLQMKANFLKAVEGLVSNPAQITPETKAQLFQQYADLFPNGVQDKLAYRDAILKVFQCQYFFFKDALATKKTHKVTKSQETLACEKESGQFFGREKLITDEQSKVNAQFFESLTGRATASQDKQPKMDEATLSAAADDQLKRIEAIKRIFE